MAIAASETIIGLACVVLGCAGYWALLPRHGKVHPLVEKWDGGSTLTLTVMTLVTAGLALLLAGLFE